MKRNIWLNGVLSALVFSIAAVCFVPAAGEVTSIEESVFRRGDTSGKGVSLMFNVYSGTEEVYSILGTLDKYGAKCTFFIGGCWADDNVECLKKIALSGHEIGSHAYFHKDMATLSYAQNAEEIRLTHEFVSRAIGVEMNLFAPPSGSYDAETVKAATDLGYKTILWSKDTIDWRDQDEKLIFSRATSAEGGDFVLMHPTVATANALESILKNYEERGLTLLTVSENLQKKTN